MVLLLHKCSLGEPITAVMRLICRRSSRVLVILQSLALSLVHAPQGSEQRVRGFRGSGLGVRRSRDRPFHVPADLVTDMVYYHYTITQFQYNKRGARRSLTRLSLQPSFLSSTPYSL